jgi:hypothetical protein
MSSPRPHRCDEFPAEYSLASCSPAELASASSAARHAATNNTRSSSYFQRTATGEFLNCLNGRGHPICDAASRNSHHNVIPNTPGTMP